MSKVFIHPKPLKKGIFLKRYKRFFIDFIDHNNKKQVAHCANPGRMTGLLKEGAELSYIEKPHAKKLKYSIEYIKAGRCWVGINTQHANQIFHNSLTKNLLPAFKNFKFIKREHKVNNSRFDFLLQKKSCAKQSLIEVKSVTLREKNLLLFPDSPSERARKHLEELMHLKEYDCHIVFIVQRSDGKIFKAAEHIDPLFAELLKKAKQKLSLHVFQYNCRQDGIHFKKAIALQF